MITVQQAAKGLRLSEERIRQLLQQGRIVGAQKFGHVWAIPDSPVIDPPLELKHATKKRQKAAAKVRITP